MSNKFKLYQTFHKKIASAIFDDDKKIKALIDNAIEKELNKSWAITRPFKRLYLKATRNDDNLIKGIKNLAPAYINYAKDYTSDYIANNLSNEISNMPWEKKLELFRHAISSPFSESSAKYINDLGMNLFKQKQNEIKEGLLNRLKPSINGNKISMKDLYKRLNAGEFNNKDVANRFLSVLDRPDYNTEANPLYKYLIKGKIRGTLDALDKNIGESLKLPKTKTASIKRALSNSMPGGGSDNAAAFEDSGVAANRRAFSASSPEANRLANKDQKDSFDKDVETASKKPNFRGGSSAGLLGNGEHVNYSVSDNDYSTRPITPLSANDIFNVNKSNDYTYTPEQNMIMQLYDEDRNPYGFYSQGQIEDFKRKYNINNSKDPSKHNQNASNAMADTANKQIDAANKRQPQKTKNNFGDKGNTFTDRANAITSSNSSSDNQE